MSRGNRPINDRPLVALSVREQVEAWIAQGNTPQIVATGVSALSCKPSLTMTENRSAITRDSGKYFA